MRKIMINMMMGLIVSLVLAGCGGGGGDTPIIISAPLPAPTVDATGRWTGSYTSSVFGSQTATLNLIQNVAALTGNYANSVGGLGSITGTVSGNTATFTITVTTPGCSGSFSGSGVINTSVNPATMAFTYNGASNASCGGSENGTGMLYR